MKKLKKSAFLLLSLLLSAVLLAQNGGAQASVAEKQAGKVTLSSGSLNVRSSNSTATATVASLANGSYITLLSRSGSWWRVEYAGGKYGYCHSDYIAPAGGTGATVQLSYGSLNVRSGAGTGYAKIDSLYQGSSVIELSRNGSWSQILYGGTKKGWVSSQYLSAAEYAAIPLSVPSYKQTDSRWASVKIGTQGKTMAQIGCATTSIAMIESYRSGSEITPEQMARQLNYTASGSVYWPAGYTAVTSSENYLSGIYRQLAQGRPVLFGAKNSAGGQHWVVITGFSGNELSASGFLINDPGSSSRTNLQQLLAAYPYFYKYFY